MTNDVESTSIVNNNLSEKTAQLVLREGMPRLLELYDRYQLKSTFFFIADMAEKYPDVVRMVLDGGHEVACHGYSHAMEFALDQLDLATQKEHLSRAKAILEDISGQRVVSFRAPALRVNEYTPEALSECGFTIDSSIASQRFDMFLSFGSIKKLNRFFAPRLPYRTHPQNLARRGNGAIIEIPISALLMPYIGTTIRTFPKLSRGLGRLLSKESSGNGKPINILVHPNEFIHEERDRSISIRRARNPLSYFLADYLRNKIKLKNLGLPGLEIYKREIEYFFNSGFQFLTLRDYVYTHFNQE